MLRFASALSLLLAMTPAAASENENPRFTARVDLTNFGTGQLAGDGDTDAWLSGKVDVYITHNKIAMEMAEQLMGVTMHEPGCSRLVAVDVEEAMAMVEA